MTTPRWTSETIPKLSSNRVSFLCESEIRNGWFESEKKLLIDGQIVLTEGWSTYMDEDIDHSEGEPDSEDMWNRWIKTLT